jgi:hypothetical protein
LSDSALVVNQFSGEWAVGKPVFVELRAQVRQIIQDRGLDVTLTWIPRQQNSADGLLMAVPL